MKTHNTVNHLQFNRPKCIGLSTMFGWETMLNNQH